MKPIILQTLQLTLIGDNAKLAEAHSTLVELAQNSGMFAPHSGYCISLMEIIDDNAVEVSIKQAALIQLKNTIKLKWKPKK